MNKDKLEITGEIASDITYLARVAQNLKDKKEKAKVEKSIWDCFDYLEKVLTSAKLPEPNWKEVE